MRNPSCTSAQRAPWAGSLAVDGFQRSLSRGLIAVDARRFQNTQKVATYCNSVWSASKPRPTAGPAVPHRPPRLRSRTAPSASRVSCLFMVLVYFSSTCPAYPNPGPPTSWLKGGARSSSLPGSRLQGAARRRSLGGVIEHPGLYDPAKERALENIFLKKSRDRRLQAGTCGTAAKAFWLAARRATGALEVVMVGSQR